MITGHRITLFTSSGALHATNVAPTAPRCTQDSGIGFMGGLPISVDIYNSLGPLLGTTKKETSHPRNSTKQRRNQSCQPTSSTWVGSMHGRNNIYAIILLKHMQPAPHHSPLSSILLPCNVETVRKSGANTVPQQREGRHAGNPQGRHHPPPHLSRQARATDNCALVAPSIFPGVELPAHSTPHSVGVQFIKLEVKD